MKTDNVNVPQVYLYNGCEISFLNGEGVMVNATEMAKAFGKTPKDYLRTQPAKELVDAVAARHICLATDIVQVVNGGVNYGTWMHETIALDFAQWLSVDFKLWCNDRIKELVKHGATALNPDDLLNPDYVIKVMTALKTERAEKQALQIKNELQAKELKKSAPKVEFHDKVLQSESLISATELANTLGFRSARALNSYLKGEGIIRKVNGCWSMCANYSGRGLAKSKTYPYTDSKGEIQTSHHLYFTEIGRKFLIDYHAKRNNIQSN